MITIAEHYDIGAVITPTADPAVEFALWQEHARRNPEDWNGTEFTLPDFEAYIYDLSHASRPGHDERRDPSLTMSNPTKPTTLRTINERWKEVESKVLDPKAPQVQRLEMRRAFFAGFTSCLDACGNEISTLTEQEGVQQLNAFFKQVEAFIAEMLKGKA